jgi:PKD repeat protein/subtilisin family serine protease
LKSFLLLACLFTLPIAPAWAQWRAKPTASEQLVPAKLVAKFRPGLARAPDPRLGLAPAIVAQARPLFATTSPADGLSTLVEVTLAPGVSLAQAEAVLAKDPHLEYVEPVAYGQLQGRPEGLPNDPWFSDPDRTWGQLKVKAPAAWDISKGDGSIVVAVIDDGVDYAHPELRDRVFYNRAEQLGLPQVDDDQNGFVDDSVGYDFANVDNPRNINVGPHGTWVAGISSAMPNNNQGLAGIGYNCRFMPLTVVTRRNQLDLTHLYQAIKYAADNGASIISLSINQFSSRPFRWQQEVINYAVLQKNVLVVAAAGNSNTPGGREENVYPASYDHVISVGGSNPDDERLADGIYSPFIDMLAPGVLISTTAPTPINYQHNMQGSSFSAPFVAGAAGLVMARYPELTALQVGELLRVTTDPVGNLPGNSPYREKLGRGRLNILRALQERHTAQSIRLKSYNFSNRFGEYAFPGDTVDLNARFINLLRPSTAAARVELTTTSPYAQVLRGGFALGRLNPLDSVGNQLSPFRVRISPDAPPSEPIMFRLGYTDAGYTDYQYFMVQTSPDVLDLRLNKFALSAAANGRLGFVDEANRQGIGLWYDDQLVLQDAGLMIGLANGAVSNSVYSFPGRKSGDFTPTRNIRIEQRGLQDLGTYSAFTDTAIANRIGVRVEQRIYGRINTPHHTYFVVHYDVTNLGQGRLDSLLVGLYADWNLDSSTDRALWDPVDKLAYTTNRAGDRFFGIKVLQGGDIYVGIDKLNANGGPVNFGDGFSLEEKSATLTRGIVGQPVGGTQGSDVAQVVGAKLTYLGQGETRRLTFVVLAGPSLASLRAGASQAQLVLAPRPSRGPVPVVPTELCANQQPMFVQPTNGARFRFYRAPNLAEPIATGAALPVQLADTARQFYVSNVDSLVESEVRPYQFAPRWAVARIQSVDSLNMVDSSLVHFRDNSVRPLAWRWDFGDGSPVATERNPRHRYARPGRFTVTLTMTDSAGCSATVSKNLRVVRIVRGPQPIIAQVLYACRRGPVTLLPSGGSRFRFYLTPPANNPIFTGRSFTTSDTALTRFWVTNVDSAIESLPVQVNIARSSLQASFDYSPKADTIIYEQITFTDRSRSNFDLIGWEWDLGDGSRRQQGRSLTYTYQAQGVYSVKLKVTDVLGCTDSTVRTFRVGRRGPIPSVASPVELCQGQVATIRPSNGTRFNFYLTPTLAQPVFTGQEYRFSPTQSARVYVTNADSIVESAPREVVVNVTALVADFGYSAGQGYEIKFQGTASPAAVSYEWDFGDGSPKATGLAPKYLYRRPGTYSATLTLRSAVGCTASVTKPVQVIHLTPPPQVQDLQACPGQEVELRPGGPGPFRFYASRPPAPVVATGTTWRMGPVFESRKVYVTQLDSLGESEPVAVNILVGRLSADFTFRTSQGSVSVNDSIHFEAGERNAVAWEWDLGNGQRVSGRKASAIYTSPGVYRLRLTVRNAEGCDISQTMELPVVAANAPTVIQNFLVSPNPSNGNFNVRITLGQFSRVTVRVYNVVGQLLLQYQDDAVLERDYPIALQNQAKGTYLVQLIVGKEVLNTRLVVNP